MQVYPVTWLIMAGIIGSVVAIGTITNLLGAAFGPWRSLAREFPEQPRAADGDRGEASLTLSRKPYASYTHQPRRVNRWLVFLSWTFWLAFALWLVLALTGFLGGGMASGLGLMLWASSFGFYTLFLSWWAWRVLTMPAWPQQVDFVADDEHLHLRRVSDVVARYPWISVPWGQIGDFHLQGDHVSFPIGPRWALTPIDVIRRELQVRTAMGHHGSEADAQARALTGSVDMM